jgi:PPK2 family polyphosphate:nucleotide phosphotransferase
MAHTTDPVDPVDPADPVDPVATAATAGTLMTSVALRLPPGPVDLAAIPTDDTPGFDGGKKDGARALADLGAVLPDLQERLFAEGRSGGSRSVLLVLQGMDTAGKGGVLRRTVSLVDPQGVHIRSFKAPTPEELEHDFLWRIRRAVPAPGYVGVFDRSHYEDVLIGRVRGLAPAEEIERRYQAINDFEAELVESGVVLVKCMLHVSAAEQKERLLARLDDPTKHWKFNPGDIDERERWTDYQRAYELALERTNTEVAPWHVVPSDRKWYRNLAIGRLLVDVLEHLGLRWPEADYDIAEQRRRLEEQDPLS